MISDNVFLSDLLEEFPQYQMDINDFAISEEVLQTPVANYFRGTYNPKLCECIIKEINEKSLQEDNFKQFSSEIRTLAASNNICVVKFIGFTSTPPYAIITEYLSNDTLESLIYSSDENKKQNLTDTTLTNIAMGIAFGMKHLHSLSIIHRDLKLSNIIIDKNFIPKISEFGLARIYDQDSLLTKQVGAYPYMSPECAIGNSYDQSTDVYSYGMLLYELCENTKPFPGLKQAQIIKFVYKQGLRPKFTVKTPESLKELIKQCWDADPNKRPTFDEIFEKFHEGSVFFTKADKSEVNKFARMLIIKMAKMEESSIRNNPESDLTSKKRKIRNLKPKSEESQEDNEEEEYYSYYYDEYDESDLENVISSIKMPTKIRKASIYEDSEINKLNHVNIDDLTQKGFKNLMNNLLNSSIDSFYENYESISKYYKDISPNAVIIFIIDNILKLIESNSEFIVQLDAKKFFTTIKNIEDNNVADKLVDCYLQIISKDPMIINENHTGTITDLLKKCPRKMFSVMHRYCSVFDRLQNPWPTVDILLQIHNYFLNTEYCSEILTILYNLVNDYEIYLNSRGSHVLGVFIISLNSQNTEAVSTAYDGIILLMKDFGALDFNVVISHLSHETLWKKSIDLLVRCDEIPFSQDLITLLIIHLNESRYAWLILLRIASSANDNNIIAKNNKWMIYSEFFTKESLRLFLILFSRKENRQILCESEYFGAFMTSLAKCRDPEVFTSLVTILTRIEITQNIFENLENNKFTKYFLETCLTSTSDTVSFYAIVILDRLCRVGYTDAYLIYFEKLVELLNNKKLFSKVIHVITSLSFNRTCSFYFIQLGLVQYFDELKKYQKYKEYADAFLKNAKLLCLK